MARAVDNRQMHANSVPYDAYKNIKIQAVELDMTPSKWISIILTYIAARPDTAERIYQTYIDSNGHADTIPEMEAVRI